MSTTLFAVCIFGFAVLGSVERVGYTLDTGYTGGGGSVGIVIVRLRTLQLKIHSLLMLFNHGKMCRLKFQTLNLIIKLFGTMLVLKSIILSCIVSCWKRESFSKRDLLNRAVYFQKI